jgi:glyoxylase-like metal-dependent hydrolase (beta-lactamase superfamily II)
MTPQMTKVGDITVTSVSDGVLNTNHDVILGLDPAETARMTGISAGQLIPLDVNCFVFELGGKRVLVDAGSGTELYAGLALLPQNLQALGFPPDTIDTIVLTHCHPDHSNGLINKSGRAVFPNAELILHETEAAFWLDRAELPTDSERVKRNTKATRASTAPYRGRMRRVPDGEALPGLSAVVRGGHTPGHTTWILQSGSERLLFWGDIVHLAAVQVPRPDLGLVFDVDPKAACESRRRVFDFVADQPIVVAGAHLGAPGFGHLVRTGNGFAYRPNKA